MTAVKFMDGQVLFLESTLQWQFCFCIRKRKASRREVIGLILWHKKTAV